MIRLYAPVLALLFWALMVGLFDVGREVAAFALLTIAATMAVQAHESRARRRGR